MSGVKYFTFLLEVLKNNFNLPMLVRRPVKKLYIVFWNQLCQTEIRSEHRWNLELGIQSTRKILTKSASLTVDDLI